MVLRLHLKTNVSCKFFNQGIRKNEDGITEDEENFDEAIKSVNMALVPTRVRQYCMCHSLWLISNTCICNYSCVKCEVRFCLDFVSDTKWSRKTVQWSMCN